jgi:hypothetical protein
LIDFVCFAGRVIVAGGKQERMGDHDWG